METTLAILLLLLVIISLIVFMIYLQKRKTTAFKNAALEALENGSIQDFKVDFSEFKKSENECEISDKIGVNSKDLEKDMKHELSNQSVINVESLEEVTIKVNDTNEAQLIEKEDKQMQDSVEVLEFNGIKPIDEISKVKDTYDDQITEKSNENSQDFNFGNHGDEFVTVVEDAYEDKIPENIGEKFQHSIFDNQKEISKVITPLDEITMTVKNSTEDAKVNEIEGTVQEIIEVSFFEDHIKSGDKLNVSKCSSIEEGMDCLEYFDY